MQLLAPPSGPGAMAPSLASASSGVLLTWLEPVADVEPRSFRLKSADLRDGVWGRPRQLAEGEGFFANWADLPAAVEMPDGSRFAHWLEKLGDDTYAYGVQLTHSPDGGETWRRLGLLHDDASPTEHGFVSYVALAEGAQAFWLDGRAMVGGHSEAGHADSSAGSMQLRTARLDAGGPTPSVVLDERVCECCQTDAALTGAGPIVVYRDRDPTEVRDIAVVRATSDGWSQPTTLHADRWQIHGCPVNGPAVAAEGNDVAVAWFTAAEGVPRVLVAFSNDSGTSFASPIEIDGDKPSGRVDVVLGPSGDAYVSWMGTAGEEAEIRLRRVAPKGDLGQVRRIATTTVKRSAGMPRMVRYRHDLLMTWVEDVEPSRVRVGVVPLRSER